jgi:hypothetical protein
MDFAVLVVKLCKEAGIHAELAQLVHVWSKLYPRFREVVPEPEDDMTLDKFVRIL